jgi:hypothetical protein
MGLVMNVTRPQSVYSDGTYVWVAALGASPTAGTISRCKVNTNCAASPDPIAAGQPDPLGIVADHDYVYWTTSASTGGQLVRCAVTGCSGSPTPLANASSPQVVVVDDAAVYWSDTSGIKKLAK